MKILEPSIHVDQIPYAKRMTRFLTYSSVGVILLYISEPGSWKVLHTQDLYALGLMISIGLSLAIGEYMHYLTLYLDRKASWLSGMRRRWVLQLLLGFVLPTMFAVSAIYIYYDVNGYSFTQTTYFDGIFYVILALLLLVSLYYQNCFANHVNRTLAEERHKQQDLENAASALVMAQEQALVKERVKAQKALLSNTILAIKDILLIYAIDKVVLYCTSKITDDTWDFTISDTIAELPAQDFYHISKGVIVARANIKAVYWLTETTYEVALYWPEKRMATVSQRKRTKFGKWYGSQILPKQMKIEDTDQL